MESRLSRLLVVICCLSISLHNKVLSQHMIGKKDCWVCIDGHHESEQPYKALTWKNELPFIITSVSSLSAAILTNGLNNEIPTAEEIMLLDASTVNGFDRKATSFASKSSATLSDYIRTGVTFIPIFFLANHHTREDVGALLALTGEVIGTTAGLTFLAKNVIPRYRPFIYNDEFTLEEKQETKAAKSFFSGHTSHTAAFTFMIAKVFHDYHPNSKQSMKVIIWSFSAALPAATAYLRVRAGKHFPSDVITGYAIGALTGILIPQLHKKDKLRNDDYSLNIGVTPGGFGMYLNF